MEIGSEEHRQRKMSAFVSPVKQFLVPTSGPIIYFLHLVGALMDHFLEGIAVLSHSNSLNLMTNHL